jgi:hypothetical protein
MGNGLQGFPVAGVPPACRYRTVRCVRDRTVFIGFSSCVLPMFGFCSIPCTATASRTNRASTTSVAPRQSITRGQSPAHRESDALHRSSAGCIERYARYRMKRERVMFDYRPNYPPLNPYALPVPNEKEIRTFLTLYQAQFGVQLRYQEAAALLTHLVQFYFLTRGYEVTERNHRRQREKRPRKQKHYQPLSSGSDSERDVIAVARSGAPR